MAVGTNCLQGFEGTNQAVNGGRSCGLSSALATSQWRLEAVPRMHHSFRACPLCVSSQGWLWFVTSACDQCR